jgi:hypothetical protein
MLAARRFVFFDVIFMSRKVEISLALRINRELRGRIGLVSCLAPTDGRQSAGEAKGY